MPCYCPAKHFLSFDNLFSFNIFLIVFGSLGPLVLFDRGIDTQIPTVALGSLGTLAGEVSGSFHLLPSFSIHCNLTSSFSQPHMSVPHNPRRPSFKAPPPWRLQSSRPGIVWGTPTTAQPLVSSSRFWATPPIPAPPDTSAAMYGGCFAVLKVDVTLPDTREKDSEQVYLPWRNIPAILLVFGME